MNALYRFTVLPELRTLGGLFLPFHQTSRATKPKPAPELITITIILPKTTGLLKIGTKTITEDESMTHLSEAEILARLAIRFPEVKNATTRTEGNSCCVIPAPGRKG